MKVEELKNISEKLIDTFNQAGRESIELYSKGSCTTFGTFKLFQ